MSLLLRNEFSPDAGVLPRPSIRSGLKDVVRHDVVVAIIRYDGYGEIIGRVSVIDVIIFAKDFRELVDQEFVQLLDLLLGSWNFFITVMTGGVASPENEVDVVSKIVVDPFECSVDQRDWRVAVCSLCAENTGRSITPVACLNLLGRCVGFVESISMEVWFMSAKPWHGWL